MQKVNPQEAVEEEFAWSPCDSCEDLQETTTDTLLSQEALGGENTAHPCLLLDKHLPAGSGFWCSLQKPPEMSGEQENSANSLVVVKSYFIYFE